MAHEYLDPLRDRGVDTWSSAARTSPCSPPSSPTSWATTSRSCRRPRRRPRTSTRAGRLRGPAARPPAAAEPRFHHDRGRREFTRLARRFLASGPDRDAVFTSRPVRREGGYPMRLTVVGCSGSFAGPDSPASSYLVQAEDDGRTWSVVLDLGNGALGPCSGSSDRPRSTPSSSATCTPTTASTSAVSTSRVSTTRTVPEGQLPVHAPTGAVERLALMYHGLENGGIERSTTSPVVTDAGPCRVGPFTVTPYAGEPPGGGLRLPRRGRRGGPRLHRRHRRLRRPRPAADRGRPRAHGQRLRRRPRRRRARACTCPARGPPRRP